MITEDFVSFETSLLLKKKGFDSESITAYYFFMEGSEPILNRIEPQHFVNQCGGNISLVSCPTLQMAMKWLREKYNIYISIQPDFPSDKDYKMCWCCCVSILHENCISTKWSQCYIETYEKAVEAAIKYTLENLI